MRVYSASEAMGPAWEHTKALMWQDRRLGRFLKLCLLAFGAELGTSFSFNVPGMSNNGMKSAEAAMLASIALVILCFVLIIYVVCLYVGSRLQLAQFDILVLRNPMVAPAWQRHGRHTWRWAGLKVTILLGAIVALLPLLIPAIPVFLAMMKAMRPVAGTAPGQFPAFHVGAFFLVFAEFLGIVLLAVMLIRFVTTLVLPGVAMEDLSYGDALRRGWELFRSDVGGMLWFAVLQPAVLTVLGLLLVAAWFVVLLVLLLPIGLVVYLVWHGTHGMGMTAWFLLGTLGGLATVVVLVLVVLVHLSMSGTLLMFARAWSLYFLGGRYPLLGHYLEPGPAVPVWTPPPSMPRDDDGGGPGFPADPALA